jgi:hypothetical protein
MLKRLAAVVWWTGLVLAIAGFAPVAAGLYRHLDCDSALAAEETNQRQEAIAEQRWQRAHPNATLSEQMEHTLASIESSPPDAALTARVAACRRNVEWWPVLMGAFAAVLLWSVAFVLGGRFWAPPDTASRFVDLRRL